MDFAPSENETLIRTMVRDFVEAELRPVVEENERLGRFPSAVVEKMASLGLLGMVIPEEWGGAGLDTVSYAAAIEEVARVCASTAVTLSVTNSVCAYPIFRFGTEAQKQKYLRPLATGRILGGFCLTEPGAGSDAGGIRARAVRKGDKWILSGEKAWVTNVEVGKVFIVFAVSDPAKGKKGISAFIVEPSFPGFRFGKIEEKMGLRSSKTGNIVLEECEVPAENLLGEEGAGLSIPLASLEAGRIGIGAQGVGIAQAALDEALKYARGRHAFGQPIAEFGAIQEKLAEMATLLDAARLLVMRAAADRDMGRPGGRRTSSMAKLFASEAANRIAYEAVQIHGGYGFSKEFPVERYYRDARVTTIYEGTSEIQRIVISRSLLEEN
jgi:alkylation response protein AidB-like acyl-CoA dehydrogenase